MPGNQLPAVTKFIWRQNGYLKREKVSLSEAFLAVYRPDVTLKELCSCGNLSESKLQNRCAFGRGLCHFCLSCRAGTYSFNHRLQKWSANICVCLHFFLNSISSFTKVPGGKALTVLCNNRWFGVNGWRSLGSSETAKRGLELGVASTSVRTVASTSSSTRLSPSIAFRAVRVLRISLSHTPLAWEALGGWNTHWHPLCRSSSLIWHWFQFSIACLISRSAPTKLVPLSEYINLGSPLLFTNLPWLPLSVSCMSCTISQPYVRQTSH